MANLVKFREDPDAMLVKSLEDYDKITERATKAAIISKDVVDMSSDAFDHAHYSYVIIAANARGYVIFRQPGLRLKSSPPPALT